MEKRPEQSGRHPDEAKLLDWMHYGPGNPEIWQLVNCLAQQHGMRLIEIETLIERALRSKVADLEDRGLAGAREVGPNLPLNDSLFFD